MTLADSRFLLLQTVVELARELPPGTLQSLASDLASGGSSPNWEGIARFAATAATREKLRRLGQLQVATPDIGGAAISFALHVAAHMASADQSVEIAWTGPGTDAVPVRRVDQVVYDLVESAKNEVLLVTFAAYKADRALSVLRDATERGVRVKLIIELAQESGGKISFDGLKAIRLNVPQAQIFYWPLHRRPRNASGAYGTMHAKCLVADRSRALVSSANLTGYALEANMEIGLMIGRPAAARLAEHFDQLIVRGELMLEGPG